MRHFVPVLSSALALLVAACSAPQGRNYPIEGQIIAVNHGTRQLTIKHEDIPGYMPAMVMAFNVADPAELDRVSAGELITATLVVYEDRSELTGIEVTGRAPIDPKIGRASIEVLEPGQTVPDAEFVDDQGKPRRLSEWRGSLVLLTFIYTRCPLPEFCPRMERHFLDVQRAVENDPSLRGQVRLLTISFDPGSDTPDVLRKRATDIGALPQTWSYLTGDADRIEDFAAHFGVTVVRNPDDEKDISHTLRTVLIGRDGRVVESWSGGDWTPDQAVASLRKAAAQSQ